MGNAGLYLLGCLAIAPASAWAEDPPLVVDDFGIYTWDWAGSTPYPGVTSGRLERFKNVKLVQVTKFVCAHLGTKFGFRYHDPRRSAAAGRPLMVTVDHPAMVNADGSMHSRDIVLQYLDKYGASLEGWSFRDPKHLLAGTWRFTIADGGTVLLENTFHVETSCAPPIA